jgi:hypothetical protein
MNDKRLILIPIIVALLVMTAVPVNAATPEEIGASIDDGIAYLVSAQHPDGSWGDAGSDQYGTTGLVLVKLQDRAFELGYDGPFDPDYPLKTNVENGLNYMLTYATTVSISTQVHGDPDTNGNTIGVSVGGRNYDTAILAMALAAGRDPSRVVPAGKPLAGWTYGAVLQDVTDWLAYGQTDNGNGRGGWYYSASNGGSSADQSNAGYVQLALMYAQDPFYGYECDIPAFVEDELNFWIDYIQNDIDGDANGYDGGSAYSDGWGTEYWINSLKTGTLLTQMAFVGDDSSDARVQEALNYIGRHWTENWEQGWGMDGMVEYQSAYCLMKGFEAIDTPMNGVPGVADWYQDFANAILDEQNPDGSWPSSPAYVWPGNSPSHWVSPELSTAWALLTLERFAPPPPVADFDVIKSASAYTINAGDPVTYTFQVVNTKEIAISNIVVTDDKLGVIDGPDSGDDGNSILDPGETWIYTKTANIFVTTTNIAVVEGYDPAGALLDASSSAVTVTIEEICPPGEVCPPVPEFPTLALPVGMIIGFVFVVYSLRTKRKE